LLESLKDLVLWVAEPGISEVVDFDIEVVLGPKSFESALDIEYQI